MSTSKGDSPKQRLRVGILHPDLGIGGAERLIVDTALGLQAQGHEVHILTSHHDTTHCFEETADGTLRVTAVKSFIPRTFFGAFYSICATLRQLYLSLYLLFLTDAPSRLLAVLGLQPMPPFDLFLVDQVSTCIPVLRWFLLRRVVFYCHFPDKLLSGGQVASTDGSTPKEGFIKRLYRLPINALEEWTTGAADIILTNSKFTTRIFLKSFRSIRRRPRIVYPGINLSAYDPSIRIVDDEGGQAKQLSEITMKIPHLLSMNRFERKKNVAMAVHAFAAYRSHYLKNASNSHSALRLVVAGGYDPRLEDNISTLEALREICSKEELSYTIISPQPLDHLRSPSPSLDPSTVDVLFVLSFTTAQRQHLLWSKQTVLLLYTPTNEHFGIVPLEAMACGVPVLSNDSGGPMESIVDGDDRTGWLRDPDVEEWAKVINEVMTMGAREKQDIAERAKKRVRENFTMQIMANQFEEVLHDAVRLGPMDHRVLDAVIAAPIALFVFVMSRQLGYGLDIQIVLTGATFLLVTVHLANQD